MAVGSSLTWLDRQRLVNERQRLEKENVQLRVEAKAREKEIEETLIKVLRSLPRVKPRIVLEELPSVDLPEAPPEP